MVKEWAHYLKDTVYTSKVSWYQIPGYKTILKCLLSELKTRDVKFYPEALVECTGAMLVNGSLLNVFVFIVYKKTNLYSPGSVKVAMELTEIWFREIHKHGGSIPGTFDFNFFFTAIKLLIEADHYSSTPMCLKMLYKSLHLMPVEMQTDILDYLTTDSVFWSLFSNWCWIIRNAFFYLYEFQIKPYHLKWVPKLKELILKITRIQEDQKDVLLKMVHDIKNGPHKDTTTPKNGFKEGDEEIPDERGRREVKDRGKTLFIKNFTVVLNAEERVTFKDILSRIPEENHAYLSYIFNIQFPDAEKAYEKWKYDSSQGHVEYPDFEIGYPLDKAETELEQAQLNDNKEW